MEIELFKSKLAHAYSFRDEGNEHVAILNSIASSEEHITKPIGSTYNLLIAMEEMAELIQATCKHIRSDDDSDESYYKVLEEYADVILALKYIKEIVNLQDDDINKAINVKIERLENKLALNGVYK